MWLKRSDRKRGAEHLELTATGSGGEWSCVTREQPQEGEPSEFVWPVDSHRKEGLESCVARR